MGASVTNKNTGNSGNQRLNQYFKDYASYHKTPGNKATHYFGITFIVVSLLGLLSQWIILSDGSMTTYLRLDGGSLLFLLGMIWYLFLDWKIAIPFGFVMVGFYFLGRALPVQINWALFIIGWVFQGVGHIVYEKNSPAFFKNLTHIMIGPLWIFARLIRYHPEKT